MRILEYPTGSNMGVRYAAAGTVSSFSCHQKHAKRPGDEGWVLTCGMLAVRVDLYGDQAEREHTDHAAKRQEEGEVSITARYGRERGQKIQ